ncbi:hypothetical protein BWQ96_01238 [Gracilariopsis chorda]|uniref:Uncharacterized protein n=1 Tax=Gracilariopsis chorda TaxID=448386 RepID=A0A2V3J370_9FLOR|nr:hypothetical protein BWQ96_01238 [Gracilariopsis chorda]|eukprot:PXF48896.1 hypothetical protein BWQ96_01238 [Gracilariopsis chorda]
MHLLQKESSRDTALPTTNDEVVRYAQPNPVNDAHKNVNYLSLFAFVTLLRDECCDFEALGQQDAHDVLPFLIDKVDAALTMHPSAIDCPCSDAPQSPLLEHTAAQQLGFLRGVEAKKKDPNLPSSSVPTKSRYMRSTA